MPVPMGSFPNTEDTGGAHLLGDTEPPLAVTGGTEDTPHMEVTGDMADTVPSVEGMDIPGTGDMAVIPGELSISRESVDSGIPLTHLSETAKPHPSVPKRPAAPHGERPVHHDGSSP